MPYKSKKQARAMHAKAARGEIPKSTVSEFDKATNWSDIPDVALKGASDKPKKKGPKE